MRPVRFVTTRGYTERNAIARLIQLVAQLLVSGNGITVAFIILAISNRRVVSKGISRVAEVGAHFAWAYTPHTTGCCSRSAARSISNSG